MNELLKIQDKTIKLVNKFNDSTGECWRVQFIFDDDTEFHIYACSDGTLEYDCDDPFDD